MSTANHTIHIRPARIEDAAAIGALAPTLAQSYEFSPARFDVTYPQLVAADDALLLIAVDETDPIGYLLALRHLTFYANGPVATVEEILVRADRRGRGVGRLLMVACEAWATDRDCALVSLATRRAAPFYRAIGYRESAVYLRKELR
jgi:GNAT superfamily N-acetyltransferase